MREIRFEALDGWPDEFPKPLGRVAKFEATYSKTVTLLMRELNLTGAKQIVLRTGHYPRDIKRDGMPKVDARAPRFPGVIVAFQKVNPATKQYDTIQFPCSTYDHWEDNLRGIALSLEALRAVDRYGVTRKNEQYAGWTKRIEHQTGAGTNGKLTVEAAALILAACASASGVPYSSVLVQAEAAEMERAYKAAAREVHPDQGGSDASMARVNEAAAVLRGHFKQ